MRTLRTVAVVLVALLAAACTARTPRTPPPAAAASQVARPEPSGFLDDYSMLRPGAEGEVALVYRDPDAPWTTYDKVIIEPVTLWRSGKQSLDPIPEDDLLRLVDDLEGSVRHHLGEGYRIVDKPGPGVMRLRLAITEARATDPVLDVLRGHARPKPVAGDTKLHPETRRFVESAHIEGELRDAQSNRLLAAGVDRRRKDAPPVDTWAHVKRAIDGWADRLCDRLERRTHGTAAPK